MINCFLWWYLLCVFTSIPQLSLCVFIDDADISIINLKRFSRHPFFLIQKNRRSILKSGWCNFFSFFHQFHRMKSIIYYFVSIRLTQVCNFSIQITWIQWNFYCIHHDSICIQVENYLKYNRNEVSALMVNIDEYIQEKSEQITIFNIKSYKKINNYLQMSNGHFMNRLTYSKCHVKSIYVEHLFYVYFIEISMCIEYGQKCAAQKMTIKLIAILICCEFDCGFFSDSHPKLTKKHANTFYWIMILVRIK